MSAKRPSILLRRKGKQGEALLECFLEIAPYLSEVTKKQLAISILSAKNLLDFYESNTVSFVGENRKLGDPVLEGSASWMCLLRNEPVAVEFSRDNSVFGFPYRAVGIPIRDKHENPIGAFVLSESLTDSILRQLFAEYQNKKMLRPKEDVPLPDGPVDPFAYSANPQMKELLRMAAKVAKANSTLLITGETGVGKEELAKYIHRVSERRTGPIIVVNCAAIPETLCEAHFFGYERGAFTGALAEGKPGLFELANHGTIILDEVGELPLHLQTKLLRVLQERQFYRVGGCKPINVDVRVIAITNQDLLAMTREGRFRLDLYHRLSVIPLSLPPLRERREDIVWLAEYYLNLYNKEYSLKKRFADSLLQYMTRSDWPGNIRELKNVVERLVIMSDSDVVDERALEMISAGKFEPPTPIVVNQVLPWRVAEELLERALLKKALEVGHSARQAAKVLEVAHSTVVRKASKYGLIK